MNKNDFVVYELVEKALNEVCGVKEIEVDTNTIKVIIDGDWKHDHLCADYLVKQISEIEILDVSQVEIGKSYDDDYVAKHIYTYQLKTNVYKNDILENIQGNEENVAWEVVRAYENFTKEFNNELLNFNDYVQDVPKAYNYMREIGIREFTISCQSTGLMIMLSEFTKLGCVMLSKLTEVNYGYSGAKRPAIKMIIQ